VKRLEYKVARIGVSGINAATTWRRIGPMAASASAGILLGSKRAMRATTSGCIPVQSKSSAPLPIRSRSTTTPVESEAAGRAQTPQIPAVAGV
jgi:hypothetical protein